MRSASWFIYIARSFEFDAIAIPVGDRLGHGVVWWHVIWGAVIQALCEGHLRLDTDRK
jgi:hypothetical protein